jgi:hypothetical protein
MANLQLRGVGSGQYSQTQSNDSNRHDELAFPEIVDSAAEVWQKLKHDMRLNTRLRK